jgi:hypothetical protein
MEVTGELHALAALPLGKKTTLPMNRRMNGTQNWF